MHGIDYTFVAAQARSRRLGRDWLGLLDLHLFWRCHSTFPKVVVKVLTRRICVPIKSFFSFVIISSIVVTFMRDLGMIF